VQREGGRLDVNMRRLGQRHRQLPTPPENVRPDRCAHLRDQDIERGACGGGRVLAPQGVNETIAWNSLRPEQDQVAEQQPGLPARKRLVDPPAGQLHGERPAQLHTGGSGLVLHVAHLDALALDLEGYVREGSPMTRQVRCECGYTARGETDAAVIALVLAHVAADHPDLAGSETADDIRGWIELIPD
jgi:hypothetical protein